VDKPLADDQSNQEQEPSGTDKPARTLSFALWLPVVLLTYVLSVGPIAKLDQVYTFHYKHLRAARTIEVVYQPLYFLVYRSPHFDCFYQWYVGKVWRVHPRFDF
jgi:hypothetical protein